MKIQCDVCNHEPATLFCCADEAALCSSCDRHIHRANKLSIKHHRLPFLSPSPSSPSPLCDICQDKKAFIFCQQDRAIICRDCDAAIHTNNHLTENHSRFFLTGVRISSSPAPNSSSSSSSSDQPEKHTNATSTSSSSFSDYLIKTLPGWKVEDLLVDDAAEAAAAHFQLRWRTSPTRFPAGRRPTFLNLRRSVSPTPLPPSLQSSK
ncbi:B-box zinc finger protein 20-like isoform X2 [Dioscorea cayenensis subsp. rotundata]|uniref:B-box zinc finger protein 20-like isoform X2 n=1 Tax=Dioscorea cayennensis subsp. rotundata TaxID=55577 RepID=A0AB40AXN5_DIOCR|nr:B-box zinc finger protein 20-like isoform X2 [Dioscorea cayenensis subsp. rotundata]